ncbi:dynein light chain Tctex-type 5-A-like [Asterias amurensis]|uniref:dynein light chain Tctex-type 5-A-like n=1 Tax=Asterias amurensis TaxID=7602 RepID=UPI003AB34755
MASNKKSASVINMTTRQKDHATHQQTGDLARKPSTSALKHSPSDRKMSTVGVTRKMSVASSASTGRKLSTAKGRSSGALMTRKMSSCSDRHGGSQPRHPSGPSVVGFRQLLVTKRLARNLKLRTTQRLAERRGRSYITYTDRPNLKTLSSDLDAFVEPSYQLVPPQKFGEFRGTINDIFEEMIPERLDKMRYDATLCKVQAKLLAGDIQEKVKDLCIERYKLITVVNIGEIQQQAVRVCSRGIWDVEVDSFVTYRYQNPSMYCVATIFGIYYE